MWLDEVGLADHRENLLVRARLADLETHGRTVVDEMTSAFEEAIETWSRHDSRKFKRAVDRLHKATQDNVPPEGIADPEVARLEALDVQTKWEILELHAEDTPPESEKSLSEDLAVLLDGSVRVAPADASDRAHLQSMADCVLVCSSQSKDDGSVSEWEIPVHKAILVARCEYFQTLLGAERWNSSLDTNSRIVLDVDVGLASLQAMKVFVEAMYTGHLQLCGLPPELAMECYAIAHFYTCAHVMQICESALSEMLEADTVLDIGNWAAQFDGTDWTQRQISRWIRKNFQDLAENNRDILLLLAEEQFIMAISSDFLQAEESCVLRSIFDFCSPPGYEDDTTIVGSTVARDVAEYLAHCRFPFVNDEALLALSDTERDKIPVAFLAERASFFSSNTVFSHDAIGQPMQLTCDPDWSVFIDHLVSRFKSLSILDTDFKPLSREHVVYALLIHDGHCGKAADDLAKIAAADSAALSKWLESLKSGYDLDKANASKLEPEPSSEPEPEPASEHQQQPEDRRGVPMARSLPAEAKQELEQKCAKLRKQYLKSDVPRFRMRLVEGVKSDAKLVLQVRSERDRQRKRERQAELARAMMERALMRDSYGGCRMFHPTNGRNNFVAESTVSSTVMKDLPSPEAVKDLLRREKTLRLDPLTQVTYAMKGQCSTEVTNQLQLRAVREAGLPDEAVEIIRSAQYLYPEDEDMKTIPHYVKYNRSKPGELAVGSPAPSCSVVELNGQKTHLGVFFERSEQHGRPLVLIGGSFT